MILELAAPGVQDAGKAGQIGTQQAGVAGQLLEGLGRGMKQGQRRSGWGTVKVSRK